MRIVNLEWKEIPVKKTTAFGVLGSVAVNLALALIIAAVFSVSPVVQAHEAQCPDKQQPAKPTKDQAPAKQRQGGHVVAVRMGWEAG